MENIYQTGRYAERNPDWHLEDSPWKALHIMRMVERNDLSPRTVADIGCGVGEILNQLHGMMPESVEFTGYDISPQAYREAASRTKNRLHFVLGDVSDSNMIFDLILVIDVFEHVEDYIGFLRRLRPMANSFIFHIPLDLSAQSVLREHSLLKTRNDVGHLHYFTEGTALATLRDVGYDVKDYFYTARGIELGGGGFKRKVAMVPRKLLSLISARLASRLLGGFSLLVLCTPGRT